MPPTIELFYDIGSPYSMLAVVCLSRYAPLWGATLELRPVLLGGIFKATGNGPPAMKCPGAAAVLSRDIVRQCAHFNVAFGGMPSNFGTPAFSTLPVMRALAAVKLRSGASSPELLSLTLELYRAVWGAEAAGAEADFAGGGLVAAAAAAAGLPASATDVTDEAKAELKAATALAVETGAIGAPWFLASGFGGGAGAGAGRPDLLDGGFFGADRIEQMAFVLGKPWWGPDPAHPGPALAGGRSRL